MAWEASFPVHRKADCELHAHVCVEAATLAVVTFSPSLKATSMASGIPLEKLHSAALVFTINLVSTKTGVSADCLMNERVVNNRFYVRTKGGTTFPSLGIK